MTLLFYLCVCLIIHFIQIDLVFKTGSGSACG
jgi:hypothetical protein